MRRLGFLFRVAFPPKPLSRARPQVAPVLPTAPTTKPPGGTIGDGWAEPDVDIEDPQPADEPTSEEPAATDPVADGPTDGDPDLLVSVAFHVEDAASATWEPVTSANVGEWGRQVLSDTSFLDGPIRIQVATGTAVALRDSADWRAFVAAFQAVGHSIDARSHKGLDDAKRGLEALIAAGVRPTGVAGSMKPEEVDAYLSDGTFQVLTGMLPGHGPGEDEAHRFVGIERLSPTVIITREGIASSVAKVVGVSRMGQRVYDIVRGQAQRPKGVTSGPVLYSPERHKGAQVPVPFNDDIARPVAAGAKFKIVNLADLVSRWHNDGEPEPVPVTLS